MEMLPKPEPVQPSADGIRVLTSAEVETLKPVFERAGASLPDSATSIIVGAIKGGVIVGFGVLQLRLHAEPFYVEPGNSEVFSSLVREMENVIITRCGSQYVYICTPPGRVSDLAEAMGMQREPWRVYTKLVQPAAPLKPLVEIPVDLQESLPLSDEVIQ